MRVLRRHRGWLSGWLIALLLFTQLATAAYACPKLVPNPSSGNSPAALAHMPGCSGDMPAMDPAQPQLCKAHCEADQQSVNSSAGVLNAPPAMLLGAALFGVLDAAQAAALASAMPVTQGVGPPAGSPPLYLALLALRN